jgi:hypothetical protein
LPNELYDFADAAAENPTFYADLDNPQTLNKYQYCFNNPINAIDPDGHSIWTKLVKVVVKVAKTGSAVEAFRDNINDAKTVADSSKSKSERIWAAASLVSEVLPVSIGDVKDGAKIGKSVVRYADDTIGGLRRNRKKDAHHIIQDATVKNLPGYNTNAALGVQLPGPSSNPNMPHGKATKVQRQRGGGTYAAERRIGYTALRRAGLSREESRGHIRRADQYFQSIGVTPNTRTQYPARNSRRPRLRNDE